MAWIASRTGFDEEFVKKLEEELLQLTLGDTGMPPRLCIRSRLRIDAGRWWRGTPLWVCATDAVLVLLAVARRKYVESVPLASCRTSRYDASTGELVLAPAEGLAFARIRMAPRDALAVLKFIRAM